MESRKMQRNAIHLAIALACALALPSAALGADLPAPSVSFSPLDLSTAANMGFEDAAPGDRQGGWTDQGPENDLRELKTGDQTFDGAKFHIITPKSNGGKSCIVLGGAGRASFPKEAEIPARGAFKCLFLLHAAAWYAAPGGNEAGSLAVRYKDGSSKSISVGPEDVGDWWEPVSRRNGHIAWTGENKNSRVGLYLSKFPLEGKELESIRLRSSGASVWGIVAASLSDGDLSLPESDSFYISEGSGWKPLTGWKDVAEGSALDLSFLQDAPAGRHGFVTARDGHFVFEDGTPARFYGVNLCNSANFLEKDWCERLAERLAMTGYNAVRFHHCDNGLAKQAAGSRTELDPVNMDRLDYLFHCLKKRGIYMTTDLYISRGLAKGEIREFPGISIGRSEFKGLAFAVDSVMRNFEEFSRNWLNHVNPYTGMAWKDDPAVMGVSLINEDTLFANTEKPPMVKELYDKLFEEWLAKKGLAPEPSERKALRMKFLAETYDRGYARMHAFVKSLGTKILITDLNYRSVVPMCLMREKLEYVDNHFYWDHPSFIGADLKLPAKFGNASAIADYASAPGIVLPTRIFGKPMTITEFNYSSPNQHNAEGGAIAGAYAALQGWDGLYRFAYAHSSDAVMDAKYGGSAYFDAALDPVMALSERMAILLFLRGDAKSSGIAYPMLVSKGCLDDASTSGNYPDAVWKLGLVGRSGSIVVKDEAAPPLPEGTLAVTAVESAVSKIACGKPVFLASKGRDILREMVDSGAVPKGLVDLDGGVFRSSTGEIELNAKAQTFKAVTPSSESLILPEGSSLEGGFLKVESKLGRGVFFAASLDKAPLRSAKRVLLLHLTDSQPSKAKFANGKATVLEAFGELPCLVRAGKARLTLKGNFQGCKLYALECSGRRICEIPAQRGDASLSFESDVLAKAAPVIAYELIKE